MFNSNVKDVNAEEAYNLISDDKQFVILDVRTQAEYDDGHIPGAQLVPVQFIQYKVNDLKQYKDKPVLVYCASGGRSPGAVDTLANNSFKNIYHLNRGLASWRYNVTK